MVKGEKKRAEKHVGKHEKKHVEKRAENENIIFSTKRLFRRRFPHSYTIVRMS